MDDGKQEQFQEEDVSTLTMDHSAIYLEVYKNRELVLLQKISLIAGGNGCKVKRCLECYTGNDCLIDGKGNVSPK